MPPYPSLAEALVVQQQIAASKAVESTLLNGSDSIDARFRAFHAANPAVYAELVRLARELRAKGHERLGIGMLWEVLRWQTMLEVDPGDSAYRLNDHYRSRYARLIMQRESDLADAFELRALRAA